MAPADPFLPNDAGNYLPRARAAEITSCIES
jgi:hypothetical protein